MGEVDTARGRRRRGVGVGKGLGGAPAQCTTKVDGSGAASWMKLGGDSPRRRSWTWRPWRGRRVVPRTRRVADAASLRLVRGDGARRGGSSARPARSETRTRRGSVLAVLAEDEARGRARGAAS